MNKKLIIGIFVVIVLIVIGSYSFNNKTGNQNLKFGLIANLTGDYAVIGEGFSKGVDLAQEEWNNSNPNMQIEVIKEDDGLDPKKGLSAYQKLTSIDNIDGLINVTTITIDVIYEDVLESGLPVALGFEQNTADDDNVVQLWPGTVPAEAELGKHIKEQGFENVVVFVDNESSIFQRFADGFKSGYGSAVTEIAVSADGTDLRDSALKATTYNPDAIVFIVKSTSGAILAKELRTLSSKDYQFIFDANMQTGFTDYEKILGDTSFLDGSIVYTVPTVYKENFTEAFKAKFGEEPTIGTETGYNAFMLLARSYNPDNEIWVENMQNANFVGADGEIRFDENGIRIPDLKIGIIQNGELPK